MSYDPFDGVLLNDPRPPVSGAVSLMLHLRVARRLAKGQGRTAGPSLEALKVGGSKAVGNVRLISQQLPLRH